MFRLKLAAVALWAMLVALPAQSAYFPTGWNNKVTIDKDDVGLNFVVDFFGKAADNHTNKLSALGSFSYTGLSNSNKSFNFSYTLTNDSTYASRIRAFGFDTETPTGNPTAIDGITGFTNQFTNVSFVENVGTMDMCLPWPATPAAPSTPAVMASTRARP